MTSLYKRLIVLFLACCLSPLLLAAEDPYSTVTRSTEQLLLKLKEIQPLYNTDRAAFFRAVDQSLAAFIDFEGFSKRVMAQYYRQATPEQRIAFARIFRKSLIETYAKAMVGFDNQKIEVIKPALAHKNPDKSMIALRVHGKDGTIYKVMYKLRRIDDLWKLYNLNIDGFNVGLQFRSQFREKMQENNRNIEVVIGSWLLDE